MERLTKVSFADKYDENGNQQVSLNCENCNKRNTCNDSTDCVEILLERLFEYENTGLESSEVEQLKAKLEIWNRFNKEDYIHKGEKATERDYYYYTNGASSVLENEVERLKTELAELKQNAIVPKFKINYIVWYVGNDKVQKGTIEEIRYYKTTGISYYLPDLQRETFWIYENELFSTLAEAEEALKKLEEV